MNDAMPSPDAALRHFLLALDSLLAVHHEAMTERSVLTLTRRPGLLTLLEADGDAGARPILILEADAREPSLFGCRVPNE